MPRHCRAVKLENVLCQIHPDHSTLHLPFSPFRGVEHHDLGTLRCRLGEGGNHPSSDVWLLMFGERLHMNGWEHGEFNDRASRSPNNARSRTPRRNDAPRQLPPRDRKAAIYHLTTANCGTYAQTARKRRVPATMVRLFEQPGPPGLLYVTVRAIGLQGRRLGNHLKQPDC